MKQKIAAMMVALAAAFAASATDGTLAGSGTAASPYEIADYADLLAFSAKVNGGELSAWAVLMQDIDASASTNPATAWTPIAKQGDVYAIKDSYTGSFDGGDHVITGLTYSNAKGYCVGLFGVVGNGGVVKNVGLDGGSITGSDNVGGVVGQNRGKVENCHNTGEINGYASVGGVVGDNLGKVENCHNTGAVSSGGIYVGGVVGYNAKTVSNCYNIGDVDGNKYVGGVVGLNGGLSGTIVERCYNTGAVSGGSYVGGVVGDNEGVKVQYCYNTGAVSGSDSDVGGVVGYNAKTVSNCYNIGDVDGNNYVGGVVGYNFYYNGSSSAYGTVEYCYSAGVVSGAGLVGGVVGYNYDGIVENSCFDKTVAVDISSVGSGFSSDVKGLTTAEMTGEGAVGKMGLDFSLSPWIATTGYPRLNNCGGPSLDELPRDEDGAYLISGVAKWITLSTILEAGTNTFGATFRQTKDISTTLMLGTEANPFRGTYDGGGHSLTVSCNDASSPSAPFRRIDGATITGLRVNGTVNGGRHSAGLVGVVDGGTNLIHDCRVSVAVTVDDGYCGGIVGHGRSFRTDLVGCVFDGSLTVGGTTGDNSGTIFGWGDSITVTLTDCIDLSDSIYPIGMGKGAVTVENCYYVRPGKIPGDNTGNRWSDRGSQAFAITAGDDVAMAFPGDVRSYGTAGLQVAEEYEVMACGDALYAVAGESVNLSLECISGGEEPRFSVSAGTLAADGAAYALVLPDPGQDVTVSVTSRPAVRDVSATIDGGKANVSFWLAGTVAADCPDWNMPFLSVTATDLATGATYVAKPETLSGETGTASGAHNVVWDFGAQGIELSGNVSFTVSYLVMPLYCVIDLSGGTNAENYAVTYLDAEPEGSFTNDLYKTEKLVMRLIAPGTFKMNGETETEITNAFYCAVFETTQKQWELVKGDNPSNFKDDADSPMRPVEQVSWNMIRGNSDTYDWPNTNAVDATSFLGVFRLKSGLAALDLPTEAQWEYACRAGTTTTYSYGDTADGNYMWYEFNSTDQTHAVGTKRPNAWDLYDMHGNVWEWCLDLGWGSYRVERGGCWRSYADSCSSSNRNDYDPSYDYYLYGFRLVRTLSNSLEGERSAEAVAGAERAGTVCSGSTPSCLAAGEYFKATLAEMGYNVPTDGTPYTVKAYGLPAGLKLKYNAAVTKKVKKGKKTVTVVVKPAKSEWWIEGVPTEALDYETNPPYLVITVDGQAEPYDLPIEVLAQNVTELGTFPLGTAWDAESPLYLPSVTNGWTVSGLPPGLKYTPKLVTTKKMKGKKVVSVTTNALPYSVYGKTKAAGLFTVMAKRKKGVYYETMKYRMLVTPKASDAAVFGDDLTNITTMAYVPVEWDLTGENGRARSPSGPQSGTDGEQSNVDGGRLGEAALPSVAAVGGKVAKVTGLPGSVTFAAANVYKDKKKTKLKQLGQTIVGTPTKPGTYVVTFTKNVMTGTGKNKKTVAKTAQILWKVVPNDAELSLGFNTSGGVMEGGSVGLKYGDLLAFSATSNAKVTASGLPAGMKLVRVDGSAGGLAPPGEAVWGFAGFTTKAGTYLVTVTATLNGKTVRQRLLLKVEGLPAWAKGTFNGNVECRMENGELGEDVLGLATITVSATGKISGKFYEGGTNWVLSAASYTGAARPEASPHQGGSRSVATETFTCSNVVAKYTYKAKEKVKGKLKTVTKSVTRTFALTVAPVPVVPDVSDVPVRGFAALVEGGSPGGLAPPAATEIDAWQNLWGSAYKAVGKRLFYTSKKKPYRTFAYGVYTNETGDVSFIKNGEAALPGLAYFASLSLKVTSAGAVTATLSYDTGKTKKDPKTKKTVKVYYKPTCATVVIPTTAADAYQFLSGAYLFFAPSAANNFPGVGGWVQVTDHDKVQLWEGGPYWATTNIGAERPEDYGLYFWWGDTTGHRPSSSGTFDFDFSYNNPAIYTSGKGDSQLKSEGWLTDDGVLAPAHDAATVHWGGSWRMPTEQELRGLVDNCNWSPATVNGVDGYIVSGRDDYDSASIFLPCAGYGDGTSLFSAGSHGHYWSSVPASVNDGRAWYLYFISGGRSTHDHNRYFGRSVRPVQGFTE